MDIDKFSYPVDKSMYGFKVLLSEPVCVGKSKGYYWFPAVAKHPDGRLIAFISADEDVVLPYLSGIIKISGDGGLTWGADIRTSMHFGNVSINTGSGDMILLPYFLKQIDDGIIGNPYHIIKKGSDEVSYIDQNIEIKGFHKKINNDPSLSVRSRLNGFVTNGQYVELKDGTFLTTIYGRFEENEKYSLIAIKSKDGIKWEEASLVADGTWPGSGNEGPCESALIRVGDDSLMCVFRHGSRLNYGLSRSYDDGKTWTSPEIMKGEFSVQPSLSFLKKHKLIALSGGRPGLYLWLKKEDESKDWFEIDVMEHHNNCVPDEKFEKTSSYTEVIQVADDSFYMVYDSVPYGWERIPEDSKEFNSVWAVKIKIVKI